MRFKKSQPVRPLFPLPGGEGQGEGKNCAGYSRMSVAMKIGRITISDRASAGIYEDRSGPEIEAVLKDFFAGAQFVAVVIPDEQKLISAKLCELADVQKCDLIVTTGGTGISE